MHIPLPYRHTNGNKWTNEYDRNAKTCSAGASKSWSMALLVVGNRRSDKKKTTNPSTHFQWNNSIPGSSISRESKLAGRRLPDVSSCGRMFAQQSQGCLRVVTEREIDGQHMNSSAQHSHNLVVVRIYVVVDRVSINANDADHKEHQRHHHWIA